MFVLGVETKKKEHRQQSKFYWKKKLTSVN